MACKHNPRIVKLCADGAADTENAQILRIYNEIKMLGKADKLIYKRRYLFRQVGPHRKNRGGLMVGGSDALHVLDTVDSIGYDPSCHADATAFEEGPERLSEKAFLKICEADKFLAAYKPGEIDIVSVACTHFNQSLAATEERLEWGNEELTIDGRLSPEKIQSKHPLIKQLYEEGLEWEVWKYDAEVLYPDLPDICQRAINGKYAAQQSENWQHAYQRAVVVLHSPTALKAQDAGLYTIRDILKTRPRCSDEVPFIVDIAKKWGGKSVRVFVEPLMRFVRLYMPAGRTIPGSTWKALANLKLLPDDMCPNFVHSILFLLAASPAKTAPSKVAKMIGAAEVSSIEKEPRLSAMKECENIIKIAFIVSKDLNLNGKQDTMFVGDLRSKLVVKVFEKNEDLKNISFASIASELFEAAAKASNKSDVPNPWAVASISAIEKTANNNEASGSMKTVVASIVSYNDEGEAEGVHVASLNSRGFIVGGFVKDKSGTARSHYMSIFMTNRHPQIRTNGDVGNL